MKKLLAVVAGLSICTFTSHAVDIVAIFGSGNPNTGWTVGEGDGITLALRAKDRVTASTANVDGLYSELVGVDPNHPNRAIWNFEFSINSGAPVNLDAYDFYLGVDTDTSVAIDYTILDALAAFNDNSYGNDSTLNGQGVEGTAAQYASIYNIAQQSQNIVFYGLPVTNPDATYEYELFAVAKGAGPSAPRLASVNITVVVGNGGATVQDLIDALAQNATNHGKFVVNVNNLLKELQDSGVITMQERAAYLSAAAKSHVGN